MSRREAACFELLKMAFRENRLSENPKACLEWINSGTPT
jgi:hypothetical protein